MNKNKMWDSFLHHFSDFNSFSVDRSRSLLNPTMKSSCDHFNEEKVVAPKRLIVHTTNQQPLFVHDDLQGYIFLNFGQDLSVQVEIQQADMIVQVLDAVLPTEDT